MNNLYGVRGIKVATFDFIYAVNDFLQEHDGNVIDIQTVRKYDSSVCYIIIYKETEN